MVSAKVQSLKHLHLGDLIFMGNVSTTSMTLLADTAWDHTRKKIYSKKEKRMLGRVLQL